MKIWLTKEAQDRGSLTRNGENLTMKRIFFSIFTIAFLILLFSIETHAITLNMNLVQENRTYTQLTSDEIAQLETIAENDYGMARTSARNILEAFYGFNDFCDCIDRNENKSSFTDFGIEKDHDSTLIIEATPNPATHYVEFYYELSEIDTEGIIMITDINGKIIQVFNIKYSKGLQAWDTREIPAGSYIYTF
jgi:hypothetical protein